MQAIIIPALVIWAAQTPVYRAMKDQNKILTPVHKYTAGNELFICIHQKNQQHYDYIAERQIC